MGVLCSYSYWKTIPLVQYFSIDMGHVRFLRFHGSQLAKWKMGDVNIHCELFIDPRLTCILQEYTFYFEEDRHGNRENTALVNSPFYADSTAGISSSTWDLLYWRGVTSCRPSTLSTPKIGSEYETTGIKILWHVVKNIVLQFYNM